MYLYIDTIDKISIGILDKNFNWLSFENSEEKIVSKIIHQLIHQHLEKTSLQISQLKGAFFSSGPGSYTGMRVSDGIAKILKWQDVKIYSFYHFEVAQLLGEESGRWVSNAFKGELFVYSWENQSSRKELIEEKGFSSQEKDASYLQTKTLIKDRSADFFKKVFERQKYLDLYYYRELESEFKKA